MVEVPSLYWQLSALLKRVDFLSIGSNDLFQFLFACDRGNPALLDRYDVLSPPALSFFRDMVERCRGAAVRLAVCGEMASRPLEAMALIGLGIHHLSLTPSEVGPVKAMLRSLDAAPLGRYLRGLLDLPDHSLRGRLQAYALDHGVVLPTARLSAVLSADRRLELACPVPIDAIIYDRLSRSCFIIADRRSGHGQSWIIQTPARFRRASRRPSPSVGRAAALGAAGQGRRAEPCGRLAKIRPAYLAALEEGDLAAMPGPAYATGFLRSYADHLGLDGADLASRLKSATTVGAATPVQARTRTPIDCPTRPRLLPR